MTLRFLPAALFAAAIFSSPPVLAGGDHSHDAAPAATSAPLSPRFTATSELFEMVGVLDGQRLTVWLDRYDDNAPVKGAKVDLELGGVPVALAERGTGEFEGTLAEALRPGVLPVTATVIAGADTDLLAGELDVHEAARVAPVAASRGRTFAAWSLGAAAVLVFLARRRAASRPSRLGGAA